MPKTFSSMKKKTVPIRVSEETYRIIKREVQVGDYGSINEFLRYAVNSIIEPKDSQEELAQILEKLKHYYDGYNKEHR